MLPFTHLVTDFGGDPEDDRKSVEFWSTLLLEARGKRNGFGLA